MPGSFPNDENPPSANSKLIQPDKKTPVKTPKKKLISIDVNCKNYKMIFPPGYPKKAPTIRKKNILNNDDESSENTAPPSSSQGKTSSQKPSASKKGGVKLTRMSRKKSAEVLGEINLNNPTTFNKPNVGDPKEGMKLKRKRVGKSDTEDEVFAERIPVEQVLPASPFGVNKDVITSPKKRRRLHELISPNTTPISSPKSENMPRFRIARKY